MLVCWQRKYKTKRKLHRKVFERINESKWGTLYKSMWIKHLWNEHKVIFLMSVRQTTRNDVSPSIYVSIPRSTYRMSQKCKIDMSFDVSNQFFLSWLFSWEFGKEVYSPFKKKNSPFITQVISFLNLKHVIESGGVSVMLILFFYVFKGKQLK